MEFPHNALTNVHKIDGVHSIYWETLSAADTAPGTPRTRGHFSPMPSPQADTFSKVTDAWYEVQGDLRRNGRIVLYDKDQSQLWVLRLVYSGLAESVAPDEDSTVADIMRCYGLKKTNCGSLRAVDLTLGQPAAAEAKLGFATAHTPTIQAAHKQIVQLRASCDKIGASDWAAATSQAGIVDVLDPTAQTIRDIYSKFISALLLSISCSLAERGAYIPLGSRLLVEVSTLSATSHDLILENVSTGLEAIELNVQWTTSGTINVSASPSSLLGLRQLSSAITDVDHTSDKFCGWDIRLAPSSFRAKIHAIEPRSGFWGLGREEAVPDIDGVRVTDQRHFRRQRWKSRVRVWLRARGISINDQERWIEAELTVSHTLANTVDTAVARGTVEIDTILWPANLCFFSDLLGEQSTTEHAAWLFTPMEDVFHDPLLDAERWFNAKAEREAAIELKRQEKEMLARSKETVSVDDGDEDVNDIYARTNQYIDAQAINGVYPTPPDGFQPQIASAPTTNEPRTSPAGQGSTSITVNSPQDLKAAANPAAIPSDFDLGSSNYENNDEEDLFGDMDTETFATNGLTEADFSFFDEPDVESKEQDDDRYGDNETIVINGHSHTINVENKAVGGMAPNLTALNNDEANKTATDEGVLCSSDKPKDIGQPQAANVLSPPESPENLRKIVQPTSHVSPTLGRIVTTPLDVMRAASAGESAHNQRSLFDPVVLIGSAHLYDDKYADHGRYDFKASAPPIGRDAKKGTSLLKNSIPRLGLHQRRKTNVSNSQGHLLETSNELSPESICGPEAIWETSSTDSGITEDENSHLKIYTDLSIRSPEIAEASTHGAIRSKKRKRGLDYVNDLVITPSPHTGSGSDALDDGISYPEPNILSLDSIEDLTTPVAELSVASGRRLKAPSTKIETLDDNDYIQLAQILADQLASRDITWAPTFALSDNYKLLSKGYAASGEGPFGDIIATLFRNIEQCDLKTYAEIGIQTLEEPAIAKPVVRPDQRRPTLPIHGSLRANIQHGIFKMQVPYVRVQRTAKSMEVLPSAYPFWETLGLGPCHGPKDISAYCIYMSSDGVQRSVDTFLDMLGSVYDGCRLGSHKRGKDSNGPRDGLVPVKTKSEGQDGAARPVPEDFIQAVESVCEDLGKSLSRHPTQGRNIVVYIVDTFGDSRALPELCAAFLGMFQAYVSAPQVQQLEDPSDLVLQIVPEGFITSKKTIAMPLPAEYRRLAFEVYDRCVPDASERRDDISGSAPAVQLAESLPRTIEFSLTIEPAPSLLHTDRCLHVAYSYKSGNGWLSAVWTDSLGSLQWSASYGLCRGTDDIRRSFSEIAKEIWETTVEISQARKTARRILVVKDGSMPTEEMQTWISLAAQSPNLSPLLSLSTIDTNPSLWFPSRASTSLTAIAGSDTQFGMYASPVSTPLANATSPELLSHALTPGAGPTTLPDQHIETDINARLINSTEETWGVILAQPLNSAASLFEYRLALASGYLVKRAGPREEDGLVSMGVNILLAQKPYHVQLKDVLDMYHGLGTLARIRGLVDPVKGVLPWHMATAVNARNGLDRML